MKAFVTGGSQHPVPEASTHDIIIIDCELEIPAKTILVASRPMSTNEVMQKIAHADSEAWDAPIQADAITFYGRWRDQLCRWLRVPPGSVGLPRAQRRQACQHLQAPLKPRSLYRQNLSRKVSLWLDEITHIVGRGVWFIPQQTAVERLCSKLQRIPWSAWCDLTGVPTPDFQGDLCDQS